MEYILSQDLDFNEFGNEQKYIEGCIHGDLLQLSKGPQNRVWIELTGRWPSPWQHLKSAYNIGIYYKRPIDEPLQLIILGTNQSPTYLIFSDPVQTIDSKIYSTKICILFKYKGERFVRVFCTDEWKELKRADLFPNESP